MAVNHRDESGQAVIEYVILMSVIVSIFVTVSGWANRYGLAQKMMTPISRDFAKAYQMGDSQAAGTDGGSPKRHPRMNGCEDCFRLFINPKEQ